MAGGPTLRKVARAAGVSTATVSNVYNRPTRMSAQVRNRVLAVADDLGYTGPDPAGRSLRSGRAGAIGMLFRSGLSYAFTDPYCTALLSGVAQEAERTGTGLCLLPLLPPADPQNVEQVRASVLPVQRAVVDGVVADGIREDHPAFRVLTARGVPLVGSVDSPHGRCVVIDEEAAGRAVGEHLAALGHRHVAVILDVPAPYGSGPPSGAASADDHGPDRVDEESLPTYLRLRLAGLRSGLACSARLTAVAAGPNRTDCGRAVAGHLLDRRVPPTAVAAMSDVLALGALEAVRERGLDVGRDVSVTGFDDVPAASAAGLTTVAQPIRDKGRRMARMLLDPDADERRVVLATSLVRRTSTGPPR
jgi:DNA-binding LacI/PurR family transcriptional regulator